MKLKVEQVKWITEHLKKMNSRKIIFRDPVVERVVDKFVGRSNVGFDKYGTTLQDERTMKMKGLVKYLNDIQEELMDAVLYIQAARDELQDLSEESLIQKFNDDEYEERISQE
jgi:site-specific DNA-adenine methylase